MFFFGDHNRQPERTNNQPNTKFQTLSVLIYFRLIVPALGSDRIYVVDVKSDPFNPKLDKVAALIL